MRLDRDLGGRRADIRGHAGMSRAMNGFERSWK
jgi:hypothetical protein